MPRTSLVVACVLGAWAMGGPSPWPVCDSARAEDAPPEAAVGGPEAVVRHPFPPARGADARRRGEASKGGRGWWLGATGLALALALGGGISLAAHRLPPRGDAGPLQVVGRVSLSPRHSAVLLRVGDRVLIVGAGTHGPPALLGEVSEPDVLRRLVPRLGDPGPDPHPPASSGIDCRIGEDS